MALCKITGWIQLILSLLAAPFCHADDPPAVKQILYSMHTGNVKAAIEQYRAYQKEIGKHDLELVQQIGLILLDKGFRSREPETQLMTLFGAGISMHERCFYILEGCLNSSIPQLQLVAINFLARWQHDNADEALNKMLASDHLLLRLEALSHLAEKKHPKAVGQAEALMSKVDERLIPIFPQIFAIIGDGPSTKVLKKLLAYNDEKVRVAAILSVAKYKRDDLLPQIRKLASHHDMIQQEACALALGSMGDEASLQRLESMSRSGSLSVRLAALRSLYRLGKKDVRREMELIARDNNLFAIAILGEMEGSENTLVELLKSPNIQVRINASAALLDRQDPRCLESLTDILIQDSRDFAFSKTSSLSGGLNALKVTPSAHHNLKDDAVAFEISLELREAALRKTINLPSKDFLMLAEAMFETHQNDLVPTLVELLENMGSPEAIAILKRCQQKAGAPLIRNYCNLALFNLQEDGPYGENLRKWITSQQDEELVRLRPYVPMDARGQGASFNLTPHETSKLLITSFESFARNQDDKGIDVLLDAMQHGNTKNRYALAGLLIRATM